MPNPATPGFHRLRPRATPPATRTPARKQKTPAGQWFVFSPSRILLFASLIFAFASLHFTRHDLHHPRPHFGYSTPLAGVALVLFFLSRRPHARK